MIVCALYEVRLCVLRCFRALKYVPVSAARVQLMGKRAVCIACMFNADGTPLFPGVPCV
jgi:hypothetical protein